MSLSAHLRELARKANIIRRTLGMRSAAGFLRNRSVPLHVAVFVLTGKQARV